MFICSLSVRLTKLFICEFCLKYMKSASIVQRHMVNYDENDADDDDNDIGDESGDGSGDDVNDDVGDDTVHDTSVTAPTIHTKPFSA